MYAVEALRSKLENPSSGFALKDYEFPRRMLDCLEAERTQEYSGGPTRYHLRIVGAEFSPHGRKHSLRVRVAFESDDAQGLRNRTKSELEKIHFTYTFSPKLSPETNLHRFRQYMIRRAEALSGVELKLGIIPEASAAKYPSLKPALAVATVLMSILVSSSLVIIWTTERVSITPTFTWLPTLTEFVKNIGPVAITVVVILLLMSVYSIAIMVERYLTYSAAKKQSLEFAARVAETLRNDRIEEAIKISEHQKAPLAIVVGSGLQEFRAHEQSSPIAGDEIDASKQALQRAVANKTAEFKRRLSVLALVGSVAPFIGLFGTVFGIINAFRALRSSEAAGIADVAGGISQALFTTALGLLVAVPAVWLFNYLTEKTEELMGEVDKRAVEIIEPFIKSHTNAMRL